MKIMNLRPAYKYKLRGTILSIVIFYSIMVVVVAAYLIGAININVNIDGSSYSSFAGYGMAATIFMFIGGIVAIREDLRLFMQNGIGRRTTFLAQVLVTATTSLILAFMGELLLKVSQIIASSRENVVISDYYYILFAENNLSRSTYLMHLESIITYTVMFIAAYACGVFISLLFYRLNKLWTVVVAVGAPVFTFIGLPLIITRLNISLRGPIELIISSPWTYIAFFVVLSIVAGIPGWLLLRRAPVKPAVS